MEGSFLPQKLHRFLRFLFWVVAVIIALEIGLRPFGYGHYVLYRPDERLLWLPLPIHGVTEAGHKSITISPDGFRYKVKLAPKKDGQVRIFDFGDSVTMGWGVDDDSTFSADLERMLNSSCPKHQFQVVNAGVNAYPNSLVIERMKTVIGDNFQPDIAVFDYSGNTAMEGLVDKQGSDREKFLSRVRWKGWVRRSAIYNFFIEDLLRYVVYYRLKHVLVAGSLDTAQAKQELDVDKFNARLNDGLKYCQSHNVKMILLVTGTRGERALEHPFQQAMLDFGREHNLPVVNMVDVWKSMDQGQIFQDHGHPSPMGHATIATQLFATISGIDSYCSQGSRVSVSQQSASKAVGN
jgi:lysophospholipase L1-like esterase